MINFKITKEEIPDYMLEYMAHIAYELLLRDKEILTFIERKQMFIKTQIERKSYSVVMEELKGGFEMYCDNILRETGNYTSFKFFDKFIGNKLLGVEPSKINFQILDLFLLLLDYLPSFASIAISNVDIRLYFKNQNPIIISNNFKDYLNCEFIKINDFNNQFRNLI